MVHAACIMQTLLLQFLNSRAGQSKPSSMGQGGRVHDIRFGEHEAGRAELLDMLPWTLSLAGSTHAQRALRRWLGVRRMRQVMGSFVLVFFILMIFMLLQSFAVFLPGSCTSL
jgi:hypothetical protein